MAQTVAMLPTAITLRNFRCFREATRLELRPVTLLYGINNAGKSALLRALPLLGDAAGMDGSGPLDLESSALYGGSFRDLRWKGPVDDDSDPDLGIALHWQDGEESSELDLALRWFDDWRRLVVRHFTLRQGGEGLSGEWVPRREESSEPRLSYELRTSSALGVHRVGFRGLLPGSDDAAIEARLAPIRDQILGLADSVQWLASTRRLPPTRPNVYPSGPRWRLRPDGQDVGAVLATQPQVLKAVSAWYERSLGRQLMVREVLPDSYRLVLRGLDKSTFDVDLIDTGEGTIQVLAVLTALAASRGAEGPTLVAIEEPESHLHPELQRALAEEICSLAAASPRPRVVVETHSEHLLLGVQLEIARRRLDPEDVLVYWIRQLPGGESVAETIVFDRDARPSGNTLPPGVFSQDTEVAREIIRERRRRSGT